MHNTIKLLDLIITIMLRSIILFVLVAFTAAFSPLPKANARSSTALNMASEVKVGDKIPAVSLQEGQADYGRPEAVDIAELLLGRRLPSLRCQVLSPLAAANLICLLLLQPKKS